MKTTLSALVAAFVCMFIFGAPIAFAGDEVPRRSSVLPAFDPVGVTTPSIFHDRLNVVFSALERMQKDAIASRDRSCEALLTYVEDTTHSSKWFKTASKEKKKAFDDWVTSIRTHDYFLRVYVESSREFQDFRQCKLFAYYRSTKSFIYAVHEEINAQIEEEVRPEYNRIRANAYASCSFH